MTNDMTFVIVPGWRNSGRGHWQTFWADSLPNAVRVEQEDWLAPAKDAWVNTLKDTIAAIDGPIVIIAHSLGCITTVHLPEEAASRIVGAFLVAPADPWRRAELEDFAPVPYEALPYPSMVVAGSDDPFCTARKASAYARSWGSDFVRLQGAGHINIESGHGPWPGGKVLLESLLVKVQEKTVA